MRGTTVCEVVGLVRVELVRPLAGATPDALDGPHRVQHRFEHARVRPPGGAGSWRHGPAPRQSAQLNNRRVNLDHFLGWPAFLLGGEGPGMTVADDLDGVPPFDRGADLLGALVEGEHGVPGGGSAVLVDAHVEAGYESALGGGAEGSVSAYDSR